MALRGPLPLTVSRRAVLRATAAVPAAPAGLDPGAGLAAARGAVFALTNDPTGNAVAVFRRAADGSLTPGDRVATGGSGVAGGLASQGALAIGRSRGVLLAANPGSDEVSAFRLGADFAPTLADVVDSHGVFPFSVARIAGEAALPNGGAGLAAV